MRNGLLPRLSIARLTIGPHRHARHVSRFHAPLLAPLLPAATAQVLDDRARDALALFFREQPTYAAHPRFHEPERDIKAEMVVFAPPAYHAAL